MSGSKLLYGYFLEFKGSPTILISGEGQALVSLVRAFDRIAHSDIRTRLDFMSQICFESKRETDLSIVIANPPFGLRRVSGNKVNAFELGITNEIATRWAELVRAVMKTKGPGHHYLDIDASETVIIVSKDEYRREVFEETDLPTIPP